MSDKMSFFEHLDELRSRIIKSILFVVLFTTVSFYNIDSVIDFLTNPVGENTVNFQVLKITSIFMVKIATSIAVGIIFSFPFILYQFLKFIMPAFKKATNLKILYFTLLSFILFFLGIAFGYYLLIPISINFFTNVSINLDYINLNYTLENYLSYLIWIILISSMIFQLPFLIMIFVKTGLIDTTYLINRRRYIIVFFFIIAALLTPPDPVSQLLVVFPLIILFELSILLSRLF